MKFVAELNAIYSFDYQFGRERIFLKMATQHRLDTLLDETYTTSNTQPPESKRNSATTKNVNSENYEGISPENSTSNQKFPNSFENVQKESSRKKDQNA